jgi:predicted GIY-YIG superfamily endonuclease
MFRFYYVYILQSVRDPARHYTGLTQDLDDRLHRHNAGEVPHTARWAPWQIRTAVAFRDRDRAASFEKYLKSHSGRVFSARHF